MPAYHQGAEVEAFDKAGAVCRFYSVDENLIPREEQLGQLLSERTRALHIIHYWGFPQDVIHWRKWCDDRDLFLIEDGAQALLSSSGGVQVGSLADLAVFCLYKSFGLPDGAAALCRAGLTEPKGMQSSGLGGFVRRLGSALSARSNLAAAIRYGLIPEREDARTGGEFLPGELDLEDPSQQPSWLTGRLIPHVIEEAAAGRRRRNYRSLLRSLESKVPAAFRTLPDGAVPIAFPIETPEASRSLREFSARGISAGILWPTRHPLVPPNDWAMGDHFRQRVVALPVHQELSDEHLERIADAATDLAPTSPDAR